MGRLDLFKQMQEINKDIASRCPNCKSKLEELHEPDGNSDYDVVGLACPHCDYRRDL